MTTNPNQKFPFEKQSLLGRATAVSVYLFENLMPDPYVFAVLLTFIGAVSGAVVRAQRHAAASLPLGTTASLRSSPLRSRWSSCSLPDTRWLLRRSSIVVSRGLPACQDTRVRDLSHHRRRHDRLMDQLGTGPRHRRASRSRNRQAHQDRLRLARRCCLQRLRYFHRRPLRLDRSLASHPRLRAQHR